MTNETTMSTTEVLSKIKAFFKNAEEFFNYCIEELDDETGCLGTYRRISMWDFNDHFAKYAPYDLIESIYTYGYDDETHKGFNPTRKYFYETDEKIVSTDEKHYLDFLTDENILAMRKHLYSDFIIEYGDYVGINVDEFMSLYDLLYITTSLGK